MKNLMKLFTCLFMVLSLAFVSSCSPSDGVDGTNGVDGAPGPQGPAGQDGEDGNANVVSVLLTNQDIVIGSNTYPIAELTQDIYDNGAVIVYATVNGNTFWEVLPISSAGSIILELDSFTVGSINLLSTFGQSFVDLRIILIAGNGFNNDPVNINSLTQELSSKGVDITNYEEMAAYYKL